MCIETEVKKKLANVERKETQIKAEGASSAVSTVIMRAIK
jgi:hypothetical protein